MQDWCVLHHIALLKTVVPLLLSLAQLLCGVQALSKFPQRCSKHDVFIYYLGNFYQNTKVLCMDLLSIISLNK